MTTKATNSMALYKGQNPNQIHQLLQFQQKSVVNELMEHFKARDLKELSVKLSIG